MIDLSIIIVNYNVKHFLEQCIVSLKPALEEISAEIIVVDNASVDGSVPHISNLFPELTIIHNEQNLGFSKANNQGIKAAKGEFVLLLNPDTVVQKDSIRQHLIFLKEHNEVGCLGTKMFDGSGNYLPESKRGFPGPRTALFRMLGLSRLFPTSKFFNSYYLGHLDKDETNEVDVLSGAYFFVKKEVLDKIGLLDESFFMYGEDIDLSYRIKKAGYKIIYHPKFPIIHYKGESTKKGSLNYVKHFYQAMIIFARKHFHGKRASSLIRILSLGIYMRAFLSIIRSLFQKTGLFFVLAFILYFSLHSLADFWANYKFQQADYYDSAPLKFNFIMYSVIWTLSAWFSKIFTSNAKLYTFTRNIILATICLLAIYGLLDTSFRSSRAILLMGAVLSFLIGYIFQCAWNYVQFRRWYFSGKLKKRLAIVGSHDECSRVAQIIDKSDTELEVVGFVKTENNPKSDGFLTSISNLSKLVRIEQLNEVVFCLKDVNIHEVMHQMSSIGGAVEYKIIGDESLSIVGSKSKNTPGEWYSVDIQFLLNKKTSLLSKRVFDLWTALLLLFFGPILWIFQNKRSRLFGNIFAVLLGKKTWVSYGDIGNYKQELPKLKAGILHPLTGKNVKHMEPLSVNRANLLYAKEYHWSKDLAILWNGLFHLGGE